MSFIGDLFGGGSAPTAPTPQAAAPTISDAASQSAATAEASRLNNRDGTDQTILTSGLGDSSSGATNVNRTTALGGNTSLTPAT
jgi:hypothetical protein